MTRTRTLIGFSALALAAAAGFLSAGPLNPPEGPVASTYKTLSEVEPRIAVNPVNTPGTATSLFRITQPGSYYLSGNITGVAGARGIEIASPGVTLDLSGFELIGVPGSQSGVYVSGLHTPNIRIRNGASRGWGMTGIDASGAAEGIVEDIVSSLNAGSGIRAGRSTTVRHCSVSGNGFSGIVGSESSSIVIDCTAGENTGDGISITSGSVTGSRAYNNTNNGISALFSSLITSCTADSNDAIGIYGQTGVQIRACTASSSGVHGIEASTNSEVADCICMNNGTASASGAGIHVVYTGNRIDNNSLNTNDVGILCDGAHNFIVRNAARGNSVANYSFPAGSDYGEIVTAPGSGFTAVNPWANFAY